MISVTIHVNGIPQTREVEPRTLLVYFLREECGLKGANVGCDTTQCGCCTVHLDGRAVKSCTVLAAQADGGEVLTIEGLGSPDALHPMQTAFNERHALQCGYCTPGMVMQGVDIVRQGLGKDEHAVRHALEGNLCRCTGYQNIVDAILDVAAFAPDSCGARGKALR